MQAWVNAEGWHAARSRHPKRKKLSCVNDRPPSYPMVVKLEYFNPTLHRSYFTSLNEGSQHQTEDK